jgi:hypothetical protein
MGHMMNAQLRDLVERLRLPEAVTLHVLRHSAASYHYLIEPDLVRVGKRMDWKSNKSTERYVHLLDLSLRPDVEGFLNPG